ncbi:MAG: cytochrome oxidase subunit III [Pseudomonadota bacterium]
MKKRTLELTGWILFTLSAVAFTIASIGDPWALTGSLLFLVACLAFLWAFSKG